MRVGVLYLCCVCGEVIFLVCIVSHSPGCLCLCGHGEGEDVPHRLEQGLQHLTLHQCRQLADLPTLMDG